MVLGSTEPSAGPLIEPAAVAALSELTATPSVTYHTVSSEAAPSMASTAPVVLYSDTAMIAESQPDLMSCHLQIENALSKLARVKHVAFNATEPGIYYAGFRRAGDNYAIRCFKVAAGDFRILIAGSSIDRGELEADMASMFSAMTR